jgi:hypothetical protein
LFTLAFQSSDARQLLGTSYDGSISVTAGARSARTPLPSRHWVGIAEGCAEKSDQSGVGTAVPTQLRMDVAPLSPVAADASATSSGRSRSRNSPMPPLIVPAIVR